MATVTPRAIVWNTTAGNKTTGSFTPAAGELLVAIVGIATLDTAPTLSDSQGGASWVLVDTFRSQATTGGLRMYVRSAAVTNTSMTVSYTSSGDAGGGIAVLSVTDPAVFGAGAARSAGGQADQASATPAPVLNQTPRSTNAIITAVMNNTNGTANGSVRTSPTYSEHYDQGFNTPPTGIAVHSVNSGETSATITWGGSTPSTFASIAIEINSPVTKQESGLLIGAASGGGATTYAETGAGVATLVGTGTRNSEALKAGAAALVATGEGASALTWSDAGAGVSAHIVAGVAEKNTIYVKAGIATSPFTALGTAAKSTMYPKTGAASSPLTASGAKAREYARTGVAILEGSASGIGMRPGEKMGEGVLTATASGALQVETSNFGDATMTLSASGDSSLESLRSGASELIASATGDGDLTALRASSVELGAEASGYQVREFPRSGGAVMELIGLGDRGAVTYEREGGASLDATARGRSTHKPLLARTASAGTSLGSSSVADTD